MIKTNNTRAIRRKTPVRIEVDGTADAVSFMDLIKKAMSFGMVASTNAEKAFKVKLKSISYEQTKLAEDNNNHRLVFFGREYDLKAASLGNRIVTYKPDEDSLEGMGQYVHYDHTLANEGESSQVELIDSHVNAIEASTTNAQIFVNFEIIELVQKG